MVAPLYPSGLLLCLVPRTSWVRWEDLLLVAEPRNPSIRIGPSSLANPLPQWPRKLEVALVAGGMSTRRLKSSSARKAWSIPEGDHEYVLFSSTLPEKEDNVKLGLLIPAVLINPFCPIFFCNLQKGGPPGLMNRLAGTWLINTLCWNPFFYPTIFISNSIHFQLFFTFFYHHCYT